MASEKIQSLNKKMLRPKLPILAKPPLNPDLEAQFRDSRIDFMNPKALAKSQLQTDALSNSSHKRVILKPRIKDIRTNSEIREVNTVEQPSLPPPPPAIEVSTTDLLASKQKLTKQLLLKHGGYEHLDKISQLILRD